MHAESLAHPTEPARRRAMLHLPHMAPLAAYAASLRPLGTVPDMDPLDGGTHAEALFLLEKPGPAAARTGFVSRDNPAPTSAAIAAFMHQAGLARPRTLLWNAIPWWNGTTAVRSHELRAGLPHLAGLLVLLPRLRAVILVGARAAHARAALPTGLHVFQTAHPSPQVRAAYPERWSAIAPMWRHARSVLDEG